MIGPCLIVATGQSLTASDIQFWAENRYVIGVNNAYEMCSRIDLLYACDEDWWKLHYHQTSHIRNRWTASEQSRKSFNLNFISGEHSHHARTYFETSGDKIIYGWNSGFQALNLSYVLGSRDAILLGFDCHGTHFFGEHPHSIRNPSPFPEFLEHFRKAAPQIKAAGMRVRNATPGSRIDCFERISR